MPVTRQSKRLSTGSVEPARNLPPTSAKRASTAGSKSSVRKGTPVGQREPPPGPGRKLVEPVVDDSDDETALAAADEEAVSDDADDGPSDMLSSLPHDIRVHIFSFVASDARVWCRYRTVNSLFAEYSDLCTCRFSMTGKIRLAMQRRLMQGHDPSQMMWDLLGRFSDTMEHLDLNETSMLSDLSGIKDFGRLQSLNLSSCWGLDELCGLEKCGELRHVNLNACSRLTDLNGLDECEHIATLDLSYCLGLEDISAIDGMQELVKIRIPVKLEEQTNVAVTREDANGKPGALTVELVGPHSAGTAGGLAPWNLG